VELPAHYLILTSSSVYINFRSNDISRLCAVHHSPRRTSRFLLRHLRRCIQKQSRHELDNLDIAWHVLATSMLRFHSSFHIFSISSYSRSPLFFVAPGFFLRPQVSLVAVLTHHLLYIAHAETPDIIFDILFCCVDHQIEN